VLTIGTMSNGRGYAANHLVHSDCYAKGQQVVGYWQAGGVLLSSVSWAKSRRIASEAFDVATINEPDLPFGPRQSSGRSPIAASQARAESASRPSAPPCGGGAKRRVLMPTSTR
jgi:hypothetical protein